MTITKEKLDSYLKHVAAFCALRASMWILAGLSGLSFFLLLFTSSRTVTPCYILLTIFILPLLLEAMISSRKSEKSKQKGSSEATPFPLLLRKYNFKESKRIALEITYFIILLMLLCWKLSYILFPIKASWVHLIPVSILVISLFLRLLITIGYCHYLNHYPLHLSKTK